MPLSMIAIGETRKVLKINGKDETRQFLNNLGFVPGAEITVVTQLAGNIIVCVKNTRVALDKSMANRIIV